MKQLKVLFVDRDGTLIEEPPSEQIDRVDQIRFLPGVYAALAGLSAAGYRLVMVTNQDGLGTANYPQEHFDRVQAFLIEAFASQGVTFDALALCPHTAQDQCRCRKPLTGLLDTYLATHDYDRQASAVIGDRETDLALAKNLGVRGFMVHRSASAEQTWPAVLAALLSRRASVRRETRETRIEVEVQLDAAAPIRIATGIGFFDHMLEQLAKHGGFALQLKCAGDLGVDEHHTVEDCALALGSCLRQALGDKLGLARYGFLLPMDEAEAKVSVDLSGRAYFVFDGRFPRDQVGMLPTELVPHFFRSLSDSLGCALHLSVRGENTHHMIEACFKGVGRALRPALRREGADLPTTKGVL